MRVWQFDVWYLFQPLTAKASAAIVLNNLTSPAAVIKEVKAKLEEIKNILSKRNGIREYSDYDVKIPGCFHWKSGFTLVEAFIPVSVGCLYSWRLAFYPDTCHLGAVSADWYLLFMQFWHHAQPDHHCFALVLAIGIVVKMPSWWLRPCMRNGNRSLPGARSMPLKKRCTRSAGPSLHHICNGSSVYPGGFYERPRGVFLPSVLHHHGHFHYFVGCGGATLHTGALCHHAKKNTKRAKEKIYWINHWWFQ